MWARKLIKPSLNQAVLLTRNFVTTVAMQTSSKLAGKVAIVTASTDGIGFEIARKLAQDGAKVVISSRKREHVDRAVAALSKEGLAVTGTVCHVGKAADRENLFKLATEKFQGIDILVSNAAVNPHFGSTLDCSEEQWDKIFEINVKAAFLLTKAAVPHMEKRGGGSIVYVGSIAGLAPFEVLGPYSISKTAILGLTKVIAKECGDKNIRVNCIAPGIIQTNFSSALWSNDTAKEQMEMTTALKRLGQPRECGGLVSFLCSDDASYITGETIVVSGGQQSRL